MLRRRGAFRGWPVRVSGSPRVAEILLVGHGNPGGSAGTTRGPTASGGDGTLPRLTNLEVTIKMVKNLLLGSAAGLVAVAGAQAADLPATAKPVEYVMICSLYGDGFFYIPGNGTCLKIGGYVRWEADVGAGGSHAPYISGGGGFQDRGNTYDYQMRSRFAISADARTQTDYGTLRAYFRMGAEETTNATDG